MNFTYFVVISGTNMFVKHIFIFKRSEVEMCYCCCLGTGVVRVLSEHYPKAMGLW